MAVQVLGKVAYFNKGAYNSQTNYEINDVVSYNGSSYVSLNDNNQGNLPTNTNYWSVVAEKGDKGDTGKPFVIEKTYSSIESMVADYDNMNVNDYVMIQGSIEEQENATLWTKREAEVSPYKWAYLADFSGASGITGATPNIHIGNVTEGNEPSVTRRSGSSNENPILDFVLKTGAKGDTGATGNGISSIEKTSTSGLVDTYTITFTNGTSTTIKVTNGRGIVSIAKTGTVDYVDTYTITYNDGTTSTFEVTNSEVTEEEFNDVVDELNYLYDDLPKVEGEGTNLTLNNTRKGKISTMLKGNLSQKTNIITYTCLGTETGDYYFVYDSINYQFTMPTISANDVLVFNTDTLKLYLDTIEIPTTTANTGTLITMNTTPNPDYPQNIQVVTGDNTIKVEGKNLFDLSTLFKNKFGGDTASNNGITFTNNNGTINLSGTATDTAECVIGVWNGPAPLIELDSSQTYTLKIFGKEKSGNTVVCGVDIRGIKNGSISKIIYGSNNTDTIELTGWSSIVYIDIYTQYTSGAINKNISIQLVKGSTIPTTYTPYVSQSYPISLGTMELCKIVDYQDYIYKENGKWYKHSEIGKIILNGSEVWEFDAYSASAGNRFTCSNMGGSSFGGTIQTAKSNMVSYTPDVNNYGNYNNTFILRYISSKNRIDVISSLINSLTEWTSLLNQKNMVIYVPLATPTNTEITDQTLIAQLDNFEKALSYNTQTNISQENNDLPFIISASAFMSLKYLFGNLETRVAELEG